MNQSLNEGNFEVKFDNENLILNIDFMSFEIKRKDNDDTDILSLKTTVNLLHEKISDLEEKLNDRSYFIKEGLLGQWTTDATPKCNKPIYWNINLIKPNNDIFKESNGTHFMVINNGLYRIMFKGSFSS